MEHIVVGMNHTTAPVDLREKLAIAPEGLSSALKSLLTLKPINEGLILSTCNRTEVYAVTESGSHCVREIKNFMASHNRVDLNEIDPFLYDYKEIEAIQHVFRVASSLDSMVLGEGEIVGQVKQAYQQALATETTGVILNRWMHRALYVAKKVRTETKISKNSVSVGSAAINLAKKIFGDLAKKKVVLIGAGEIAELVLAYLEDEGVYNVSVVNRTIQKALQLTQEGYGVAYSLDQLWKVLADADVVISSISTKKPLVGKEKILELMTRRKNKPMFFIDLGVPRNVDSQLNNVHNIYLYNIDDLKTVVDSNMSLRKVEAKKAEEIIQKEASQFYATVVRQEPTIASLGKKFDYIRKRELEKTLGKLGHLSTEEHKAIEKCTEAIVSRILHDPILMLKTEDQLKRDSKVHELIKKLFKLEDES